MASTCATYPYPLLDLYGANDKRITGGVPAIEDEMKKVEKFLRL